MADGDGITHGDGMMDGDGILVGAGMLAGVGILVGDGTAVGMEAGVGMAAGMAAGDIQAIVITIMPTILVEEVLGILTETTSIERTTTVAVRM
jgi:hypothetical protein